MSDVNLSAIAAFIAARLQYPRPVCNGKNTRVSTIVVKQHKSKFDRVCVYCELANAEQVRQAWAESSDWTESDEVPQSFHDQCLIRDGEHYRHCYLEMIELVSQQTNAIFGGADHCELLMLEKDKLDVWLVGADPGYYCAKWNVKDVGELKARLYKMCCFK